ncbi:MAG: F420-dependent methylenetetrahydromethanopterin dehydrogenase [Gammaproteobacteria bacterium]|nr:F420-dependent methylenetetrahydromethanopterin dehydrogenase [Gammaproteobacteria bacterium]
MAQNTFKLGVLKLGCIGAAPLLDLLLDERADREDLEIRAFTCGAKLDAASCEPPTADAIAYKPDLLLLVSPNAALAGPAASRTAIAAAGIPLITISDGPSKKAFFKKNEEGKQVKNVPAGQGFFVLPADSMIGARREFLDPSEMALFNSDVIKVLAATGVLRLIQQELDRVIGELKAGATPTYPTITVNPDKALAAGAFGNPYAAAKAYAALALAEATSGVTADGCFKEQDPARYITMVAAGHEMMRMAARLADEARELEKAGDTLVRTPHAASGEPRRKTALAAKPE